MPVPKASVSWALNPQGPFKTLWTYDPKLIWKDGRSITLRYQIRGMAIDGFRLAAISPAAPSPSMLQITHLWREGGQLKQHTQSLTAPRITPFKRRVQPPAPTKP